MPSKTSLFRKELLKQDFRNVGWIGIVYFLGLVFTLPLQLLFVFSSEYGAEPSDAGLFATTFMFSIQGLFLFTMPVLMSVFLFRYMHVKASSDFTHSLPVKRETLFNVRLVSGLLFLLIPVLAISLIMLMFYGFTDASFIYTPAEVGYWTLLMSVVTVLVFMSGVFVATVTGLSAVQGVLTYILLLLPIGVYSLVVENASFYTKGLSIQPSDAEELSPIVNVIQHSASPFGSELRVAYGSLLAYAALSVVFYFLARWIYKKRPLEAASQAISFFALKPIFRFGTTVCFALFGGVYFGLSEDHLLWTVFGYVVGALFGYFAATMLIEKTWRVFSTRQWKGLSLYAAITFAILILLPFAWKPYESYVPKASEVEAAFIANHSYEYRDRVIRNGDPMMTSPSDIEALVDVHESLLKEADASRQTGQNYFITYQLENGDSVRRSYMVNQAKVMPALRQLAKSRQYKDLHYPITQVDPQQVLRLTLQPEAFYRSTTQVSLIDGEQIEQLLEKIKEDIYRFSYDEMIARPGIGSQLNLLFENQENQYRETPILDSRFTETIEWLKEQGLYDDAFLQAKDVDRAEVYPWSGEMRNPTAAYFDLKDNQNIEPLTIEEEERLAPLLEGDRGIRGQRYIVALFSVDYQEPEILSFSEENAPDFIKQHFNE